MNNKHLKGAEKSTPECGAAGCGINELLFIENRYTNEEQLSKAIKFSNSEKAQELILVIGEFWQQESLHRIKEECICLDFLMKISAKQGGVHPIHIEALSQEHLCKIEALENAEKLLELLKEMSLGYLKLVKNHSLGRFSPPIQRVLTLIEADLTANLRLSHLAKMQNISPAYLSTLFKKETGETVTAFVNKKRIGLAKVLLETTSLSIGKIAIRCGLSDLQYFSKTFKKQVGFTPKEYREKERVKKST